MKRNRIYSAMMRNYLQFVLLTALLFVIVLCVTIVSLGMKLEKGAVPLQTAQDIAKPDYRSIALGELESAGASVEVLDEAGRVVHTIGPDNGRSPVYTDAELYLLLGNKRELPYYTTAMPVAGEDGKPYLVLLKIPMAEVSGTVELRKNAEQTDWLIGRHLLLFLAIFLLLQIGLVLLYARRTSRKISRPLHAVAKGLQQLTEGQYDTRIQIAAKAHSEIAQLRDAYHYLAGKLSDAEKEKAVLEQSKNHMLLDLSHDLKTPLTSIQGYARALQEGMVPDEERKERYLKLIHDKSVRLTNLIDAIFELLTMDTPGFKLTLVRTDLAEFLREIAAEFYEELEEKLFKLEADIPHGLWMAGIDPRQMARVLSNLITNAMKYNPPGTELRLALRRQGSLIAIEVADNGVGIPQRLQPTLFEPFVRGDEARNSLGGAGLGLAIAKKIVEKHRGTLALSRHTPGWTVFTILLSAEPVQPNTD
ncbi:HAMP domain-containing sensor histidine kinase [Paenibacillus sp. GYB004]|uniref:sensor histidine kinase n=1 Tax=Paenibacillus sp. GYB004 TaxID=2994393 RepID=UPI002F968AD6